MVKANVVEDLVEGNHELDAQPPESREPLGSNSRRTEMYADNLQANAIRFAINQHICQD
ncbi:MAG: hypothetical protein WBR26_03285 [Candidatus Acidiferrum sp.]